MAKKKELRDERFAREYVIDLNGQQAAIRAGYSAKTAAQAASRLLKKVNVKRIIAELSEKKSKELDISSDYVLRTVKETIERCRQAEQVFDKKGQPVFIETADGDVAPAFVFKELGVLKGCELLGKHLKLFQDRTEVTGPGGGPVPVQIISHISRPKRAGNAPAT